MKLTLPFLLQLRGQPPDPIRPAPFTGPPLSDQTVQPGPTPTTTAGPGGRRESLGGWVALTFQQLVAAIQAGYGKQHNVDDTHSTITASGSISERNRTTPLGEFADITYSAAAFTSLTGTWTVRSTTVVTWSYTLIGRTLIVTWNILASQLSGTTSTTLRIALPTGALLARPTFGTFAYDDNGTRGTGVVVANPGSGDRLLLLKDLSAVGTWSVSSNLSVTGQIACEVTGL